jgi:post-segregation antitoxin (ccd killing protein)
MAKDPNRFTVYLPADLRERAIAADLPMSELLRTAVIAALRAREDAGEGDPPASSSSS